MSGSGRIVWSETAGGGYRGEVGGLSLFGLHWGVRRSATMWDLSTRLPVASRLLGQHYATQEDAHDAAARLLEAFLHKIGGAS